MAKKLVYNYTFDASAQTISFTGLHKLRTIQLITNVTDNIIIYNFASSTLGATSSYDGDTDTTTLTLSYDTTSMSDSDELQIFVDEQEARMDVSESLLDPVHKMRVSTPQNLIDTDFEYGLQPTKWETIELVDNIPSVYTRDAGVSIGGISVLQTTENSETITVTTTIAHELSVGDPIEVQGTSSRTANGKYLVTVVPSTTKFVYKASAVQASTENIKTAYTTIIPGSFFSGSELKIDVNKGIETDNASPSVLSMETEYAHGMSTSTSLYITNTVGKKSFSISSTTDNASDGSAFINTTDNTIFLEDHNFFTDQRLFIFPSGSGVLPDLTTGITQPSGEETINTVYDAVNTAVASIITNDISSDHREFYMSGGSSNYAYYNSGGNTSFTSNSTTERQYVRYGHYNNNSYHYYQLTGSSSNSYRWQPFGEGTSTLYTGEPVNLGLYYTRYSGSTGPSNLSGLLYFQSTPYTNNSLVDSIISVKQMIDPAEIYSGATSSRSYNFAYNSMYGLLSNYRFYDYVYHTDTRVNLSGNWYYTWAATKYDYPNAAYSDFLKLTIWLENDDWDGVVTSSTNWQQLTSSGTYGLHARQIAYKGCGYEIEVLLPLKGGASSNSRIYFTTGSVKTAQSMVQDICTQVASALTNQSTWGAGNTGINTVRAIVQNDNRISIKTEEGNQFLFDTSGTAPITVETDSIIGVVDNYYNITGVGTTTISITAETQLKPREITFADSDIITENSELYINYDDHSLKNGQKVKFHVVSGTAPTGLTSDTDYFAYVADNNHLFLSDSVDNWETQSNAITASGSGSFKIEVFSISGRVAGLGTVGVTTTSTTVTGTGTKFQSTFKIGDNFNIVSTGSTVNNYIETEIKSIVSDTSMTLAESPGITTSGVKYYVDTKVNVRADGSFIHRPFDGGVEITAGKSPDSTIVRQTRKYFRYQSGKGIQCSMAINFNPARPIRLAQGSGTSVTITTEYPHGLTASDTVKISGASDSAYNGSFTVTSVTNFTFSYTTGSSVSEANPTGFIEFSIDGYSNAGIRGGLFDFQNGFFYEYDGSSVYAVRRSSVQQCSGTVTTVKGSNIVTGSNTRFSDQLSNGDMIVIRGQSYKITSVESQTELHIQPYYRGASNNGVVVTKTVDTKVAQSSWNIDKADGTGPSGYNLDINKIQMVYLDYSWYGAGKIRFGFKDTYGHVKYVHEFIHNNKLNEAYMRSGNIPARYEAFNSGLPSYVPSLFHWGTSVIMDGGFDNDDSYLFSASGNTLTFTNGDVNTATTNAASALHSTGKRYKNYYVKLSFPTSDASKFQTGISLYTSDGELSGQPVAFTDYGSSVFNVYVYISSGFSAPAVYPNVADATAVSIGAESAGTSDVDLTTKIPLISIRLAPSVDNNLIGELGERDIINRMQLKLKELGVSISHDATINVILNGSLSNLTYSNVGSPSLSQYIAHAAGDTIDGGTTVYQFRASGGDTDSTGKRLVASNAFDMSSLVDLGNSILGGDGVFPNGPDIITISASVINTSEIDSDSPFQVESRLSWSESQA